MSFGLTAAGYVAPREADFLTLIRDQFDARLIALGYTELPDYERDTFLGQITEVTAHLLAEISESGQAVYDERSVSNAVGIQLNNLALLVGVQRHDATFGSVALRLTGTAGYTVPNGKIVEGGGADGKARWMITAPATFDGSGTANTTAKAMEPGEIIAVIGSITKIVTPIAGWDAVTNSAPANPGQARESDSDLRARRQRELQQQGSTSTNAILSALLALDVVSGAIVIDNKTGSTAVVDGLTLDPYSVGCVVTPNTMGLEDKELVIRAIYGSLGAGTATSGTQSGDVTKRDGRTETVRYFFASPKLIKVDYVLIMETGYVAADVAAALTELVEDYFLTLRIGETVYPSPLIALAMTIDGIANVTSLLLDAGTSPITSNADELPSLDSVTVS